MHLPEPIRIISDLHLGYSGNLVPDAAQLRPLLDGIGTLVCNGDTAELLTESQLPEARVQFEKLRSLSEGAGVRAVFVNGNHDPAASDVNHLDLADGAILVTHGDLLFTDLVPWSRDYKEIGQVHRRMIETMDADSLGDFETRLRMAKDAIMSVGLPELHLERGRLARAVMFLLEFWPPDRPFTILRCWREVPRRAAALLRFFRPRARFAVIGHFHLAGIARVDPRIIINTGSFTPLLGRTCVDIEKGELTVKRINRDRSRRLFSPGREIARFPISPLSADESDAP